MVWKAIVFVALGLVIGYALSGIPVRRELQALRAERDQLRVQLDNASRPNLLQAFLPGLTRQPPAPEGSAGMPVPSDPAAPERADGPETRAADARPAAQGDVVVIGGERTAAATPVASPAPDAAPGSSAPAEPGSGLPNDRADARDRFARRSNSILSNFDQLVTAQRVRTAAARAALVEQAGLSPEQMARFDGTVSRMNEKLEGYGQEMIDQAASEEPPTPSQALGLGHDVSGILHEGQKELDALVGDKKDAVDPTALQIWNYVDVEQWRPYVEQQLAAQGSGEKPRGGALPGAAGQGASSP